MLSKLKSSNSSMILFLLISSSLYPSMRTLTLTRKAKSVLSLPTVPASNQSDLMLLLLVLLSLKAASTPSALSVTTPLKALLLRLSQK